MKKIATLLFFLAITAMVFSQNNALQFDGVDDYVEINAPNSLLSSNVFTIELWYKPAANASHQQTLICRGTGSHYWTVHGSGSWNNSGSIMFYHPLSYPTEDYGVYSFDFSILNQWHHVAITSDGAQIKFYHDGVLIMQDACNGTLGDVSGIIRLGAPTSITSMYGSSDNGGFFSGAIDEVRLWNTARSETEIKNNMQLEMTAGTPGLAAYYNFNQGTANGSNTGTTGVTDAVAGVNGSLNNFSLTGSTSNFTTGFPLAGSLPVTLVDFSASQVSPGIQLKWTTSLEENFRVFEIEKSTDGSTFTKIGQILPNGVSTGGEYGYTDYQVKAPLNFYRLRIVDVDGTAGYSKIVTVKNSDNARLVVFPNPARNELHITTPDKGMSRVSIFDVQGKAVRKYEIKDAPPSLTIDVSTLQKGVYIIQAGKLQATFIRE